MFREILTLLTDNFATANEKAYISFATDAINAIYHVGSTRFTDSADYICLLYTELGNSNSELKVKSNFLLVNFNY